MVATHLWTQPLGIQKALVRYKEIQLPMTVLVRFGHTNQCKQLTERPAKLQCTRGRIDECECNVNGGHKRRHSLDQFGERQNEMTTHHFSTGNNGEKRAHSVSGNAVSKANLKKQ